MIDILSYINRRNRLKGESAGGGGVIVKTGSGPKDNVVRNKTGKDYIGMDKDLGNMVSRNTSRYQTGTANQKAVQQGLVEANRRGVKKGIIATGAAGTAAKVIGNIVNEDKTQEGKRSSSPVPMPKPRPDANRERAIRSMKANEGRMPLGDDMTPMPRRRPSSMDGYKGYPMPEKRPKK